MNKQLIISEAILYFSQKLNISSDNQFIADDIRDELINLNIHDFKVFFNENYINSKYDFKNGIAKFDMIVRDYKNKKNEIYLASKNTDAYSKRLFDKTVNIFNTIDRALESQQKELKDLNIQKILKDANFDDKDISVLIAIGKRERLMYLVKHHLYILELEIKNIVNRKTLQKTDPRYIESQKSNSILKRIK